MINVVLYFRKPPRDPEWIRYKAIGFFEDTELLKIEITRVELMPMETALKASGFEVKIVEENI